MSVAFERAKVRLVNRSAAAVGVDPDVGMTSMETPLFEVLRRIASGLMEPDAMAAWEDALVTDVNTVMPSLVRYLGWDPGELQARAREGSEVQAAVHGFMCTLHAAMGQQTVLGLLLAEEVAAARGDSVGGARVSSPPPAHVSFAESYRPPHGGFPGLVV